MLESIYINSFYKGMLWGIACVDSNTNRSHSLHSPVTSCDLYVGSRKSTYLCSSVFERICFYHTNWVTELQESLPMEVFLILLFYFYLWSWLCLTLFTVDLQAVKSIYGVGRKGSSNNLKELDVVWDIITCLISLHLITSSRIITIALLLNSNLRQYDQRKRQMWFRFSLYKQNGFLFNIVEACISITVPLSYQISSEKPDLCRRNHCTLSCHLFLVYQSY